MDHLNKFVNCYHDLTDFEESHANSGAEDNVHGLEVLRVVLNYLWTQVNRSYEECRDYNDKDCDATHL